MRPSLIDRPIYSFLSKMWVKVYLELRAGKKVTEIRVHPVRVVETDQALRHTLLHEHGKYNGRPLIPDPALGYDEYVVRTVPGPDPIWEAHRERERIDPYWPHDGHYDDAYFNRIHMTF